MSAAGCASTACLSIRCDLPVFHPPHPPEPGKLSTENGAELPQNGVLVHFRSPARRCSARLCAVLRVNTTVVAIVTADQQLVERSAAPNVAIGRPDPELPALDRSAAAWSAAKRTGRTYFVHDADPLAELAEAWTDFFDGSAPHGSIEVARASVLARWRAGSVALPDYYLLDAPDDLTPTMRHWYLGILAGAALTRVVAREPDRSVGDHLGFLPAGRWWPPLDQLLDGIEHVVPDRLEPVIHEQDTTLLRS